MLGSFGKISENSDMHASAASPYSEAAPRQAKKPEQYSDQVEREWSELPYAMMRLTSARKPWEANRLYWRDRNVQLGEIDLHLHKTSVRKVVGYTATYSREELRRDFSLHPSLEGDQLHWSAPGICDTVRMATDQLAEKLLARLVTFYTAGL